ncbi:hypothetical protein [Pseudomonas thivervalensis]|uniref:hypothetical protein n=1 Tax=Pseudomonas thivervalensis TaxID=86265 RepID=UPI003D978718
MRHDASVVSRFLPTHCTILRIGRTKSAIDPIARRKVETKGFKQVSAALNRHGPLRCAGSGKLSTGCGYRCALHKHKLCSSLPIA